MSKKRGGKREKILFDEKIHEQAAQLVHLMGKQAVRELLGMTTYQWSRFFTSKKVFLNGQQIKKLQTFLVLKSKRSRKKKSLLFHKGKSFPFLKAYEVLKFIAVHGEIRYIDCKLYANSIADLEVNGIVKKNHLAALAHGVSTFCKKPYSVEEVTFLLKKACEEVAR